MEAFEGKGRTCAVPHQPLDTVPVMTFDTNGGVDAEPSGALPCEHAVGVGIVKEALGSEVAKDAPLYDPLKIMPVGRCELAGRMESDVSVVGCGEYAVEDDEVKVEVHV
jgi:hypothetical protein